MDIRLYKIVVILLFVSLSFNEIEAQDFATEYKKIRALVDKGKYAEGYKMIQAISEQQLEQNGDTGVAYYNYAKGSCLYFLENYSEAIPCLQKAIQIMDKNHCRDCDYLEMLYGIGMCYKKLGNYEKAEEFLRRTILKGNYMKSECAIRSQTYTELADLYSLIGKPDFADICTSRIKYEMKYIDAQNLDAQIDDLWELYKAYNKQGRMDECINALKNIVKLINDNQGKVSKDYLLYSSLLSLALINQQRFDEAAVINKDIIEFGKQFKTYREEIANAYENYLRYLAGKGKVDSIEMILPAATKYCLSTKYKDKYDHNLYEIAGLGLCDAGKLDEGIKYLEKKWKGKSAYSIKALDYLGFYYFLRLNKPEKALLYYKEAEKQINEGLEVNDNTRIIILEYLVEINERLGNRQESNRYSKIIEPLILGTGDKQKYVRYLINWSSECANSGNNEKCTELVNKINELLNHISIDDKLIAYNQMAFACIKTNKYDEAIDYSTKGISLSIKEKGEESVILESLYHNLGRAYMLKGLYTEALSALNKSKELQVKHNGEVMQRTADYIKECESK